MAATSELRRLALALALSLLLHALAVMPLRLPFGAEPLAGQIYVSVQLQPAPPARPAERRPEEQAASADAETKLLTAPDGRPLAAGKRDPSQAAASPAPSTSPQEARVLEQPAPPEYPPEARRRKLEGCVLALVSVGSGGEVDEVRILESDHPGIFDAAVKESQKAARYLPAQKGGEAVDSRVLSVAAFVLEPGRRMNCALKYAASAARHLGETRP
jgi:TonB family protein